MNKNDKGRSKRIEEKILDVMERHPRGKCISEVARDADVTRITARRHLEALKDEGTLDEKKIAGARIFFLGGNMDV